jgi:alpha-amylase
METSTTSHEREIETLVRTILHAHNWKLPHIAEHLEYLKSSGFDAVQISPVQKSPVGDAWYLRYQPVDHLQIEGLGDRSDLEALCSGAAQLGMTIVADVVFNHMAVPPGARRSDWLAADAARGNGDSTAIEKLYDKLNMFPHLTRQDFAPWRDMQGDDWDNDHRYESWGNGEWPELLPTENVLRIHNQHLRILWDCGVRGIRFDAVKHMRPSHLAEYVKTLRSFGENCWFYGEVFSDNPVMHSEYQFLFPTTDFPFIQKLKSALARGSMIELNPDNLFLSQHSIRFGNNHDLACNPKELVSGLLFEKPEYTRLANCLAIVFGGGTGLVFAEDFQRDPLLKPCVQFRAKTGGVRGSATLQSIQSEHFWSLRAEDLEINLDLEGHQLIIS